MGLGRKIATYRRLKGRAYRERHPPPTWEEVAAHIEKRKRLREAEIRRAAARRRPNLSTRLWRWLRQR
jgi:hypothetical protein